MAAGSYSELLLSRVRAGMKRRGWNRAALAKQMHVDRRHLRSLLTGRAPLTVDELFSMVEALQLTPTELGLPASLEVEYLGTAAATEPVDDSKSVDEIAADPPTGDQDDDHPRLELAGEHLADDPGVSLVDPDGPQAAEILRLGFALGVDIHLVCNVDQLRHSGVPKEVLARFPDLLPIKLDAAYHHANRARYQPEGLHLRLSFDRIRSCLFPWSAIRQVTLFPEPPLEPDLSDDPETESQALPEGPTLRLVKS